eukprot:6474127-Amphidinium_carterae.1
MRLERLSHRALGLRYTMDQTIIATCDLECVEAAMRSTAASVLAVTASLYLCCMNDVPCYCLPMISLLTERLRKGATICCSTHFDKRGQEETMKERTPCCMYESSKQVRPLMAWIRSRVGVALAALRSEIFVVITHTILLEYYSSSRAIQMQDRDELL